MKKWDKIHGQFHPRINPLKNTSVMDITISWLLGFYLLAFSNILNRFKNSKKIGFYKGVGWKQTSLLKYDAKYG